MSATTIDRSLGETHWLATRKAMLRLLPLMCAIYFLSFIDRTNVALAKSALAADLGISAALSVAAESPISIAVRWRDRDTFMAERSPRASKRASVTALPNIAES